MTVVILVCLALIVALNAVLLVLLILLRKSSGARYDDRFALLESGQDRLDKSLRDEMSRGREESGRGRGHVGHQE